MSDFRFNSQIVTLALMCATDGGPALLVTEMDRELAVLITDRISAATASAQAVTYTIPPMDVHAIETMPAGDTPDNAFIQPSSDLSGDLTMNGYVIHPGDQASFEETYGGFDYEYRLQDTAWEIDEHGAVLTVTEKHTGRTYESQTVPADVFPFIRDQLDPDAVMTFVMDTDLHNRSVLAVTLNRHDLTALLRVTYEARAHDTGATNVGAAARAYLTTRSDDIDTQYALYGTDTLPTPRSAATFASQHPHPLYPLDGAYWSIHDQELRLHATDPATGRPVTSTDLTGYLLSDALLALAPDDVPAAFLHTPDGDLIVGSVSACLQQTPVTFRRSGPQGAHSQAIDTATGPLIADPNPHAATLTAQPTWTPRDAQGRETPWIDRQGRLWATEDLTVA